MKRILPAYPLFVKDPYFSLWSPCEELNSEDVIFWTGHKKKMYGIVKVDGVPYSFLGKFEGVKKAKQTSLSVTAFSTCYEFTAGGAKLKLSFVSPLPPDDVELLSCPVCYMKYEVTGASDVQIILALNENVCYNEYNSENEVRGGAIALSGFEAAFFGLSRQKPFSNNDDSAGADWGHFYLSGERTYFTDEAMFKELVLKDKTPQIPERQSVKYIVSVSRGLQGAVMTAFDDTVSINYFGNYLKGYYLENKTVLDALGFVHSNIAEIDGKLNKFDQDLRKKSAQFGEEYYNILCASLRQSVAAHKAVRSSGGLLFLSKECHSNGCIATVDVSYPSVPLYLLYNPELVRGMMRPIFEFSKMPVWGYNFAPHDAGTYPNCTGQVYGLNEHKNKKMSSVLTCWEHQTRFPMYLLPKGNDVYCFENQMPVEESANMLVMVEACHKADGKLTLARENFEILNKWADFLVENGLKPANQLCTDDFAGHLGNNLNLAIKATVGIACFAEICKALNNNEKYAKYRKTAEDFAAQISKAGNGGSLPLIWDGAKDTFSLKYNLAFDKILGLGLFAKDLREREADLYLTKLNRYGVPLDSRKDYSKSDWLMWAASLTDDIEKKKKLIHALDTYLKETPDRIPFSDWYDTVTGKSVGFQNRTVQGGCFILLL